MDGYNGDGAAGASQVQSQRLVMNRCPSLASKGLVEYGYSFYILRYDILYINMSTVYTNTGNIKFILCTRTGMYGIYVLYSYCIII